MRKKAINLILIFLFSVPAQIKAQNNKFIFGFRPGYALGVREKYTEYNSVNLLTEEYEKVKKNLGMNYGIYLQYFFNPYLGIQVEFNHQKSSYYLERNYDPEFSNGYTWDESFNLGYLDLIYKYNSLKEKNISPYFTIGLGIKWEKAQWAIIGKGSGSELQGLGFRIGGGIKHCPFPKFPQLALNLSASYSTSLRFSEADNYLAFQIGLEYGIWKIPFRLEKKYIDISKKFVLGINSGYSFGLEEESDSIEYKANMQYYFTPHWGIKGEIESVTRRYKSFHTDQKKKWEAHFAYINAVYKFNDSEKDRISAYLSTGFGFTPTAFGTFGFKIGGGVTWHLSPNNLPLALNLGLFLKSFIFIDPFITELADIDINTRNHIGLNVGIEYSLLDNPYEIKTKDKKTVLGMSLGTSKALGGGRDYIYSEFLPIKEKDEYGFNFSGNIQYYFNRNLGVQWEINYQRGENYQEIYSMYNSTTPRSAVTTQYSNLFGYVNLIYKFDILKKINLFPYLSCGAGIDLCGINRLGYKIGGGTKYNLFPKTSQWALNQGIFYNSFIGKYRIQYFTAGYITQIAGGLKSNPNSYLRLNIGLEYSF